MNFETALQQQLDAKHGDELTFQERRAKRVLGWAPSERRKRILERWEKASIKALGNSEDVGIDWSTVDWAKWLSIIVSILGMLLMFLGTPEDAQGMPEEGVMRDAGLMEWAPGDMLWRLAGDRLAAYARKKWPNIPGTDDDLAAFFTAEIKEAMS